jgi:hypothetical protein
MNGPSPPACRRPDKPAENDWQKEGEEENVFKDQLSAQCKSKIIALRRQVVEQDDQFGIIHAQVRINRKNLSPQRDAKEKQSGWHMSEG